MGMGMGRNKHEDGASGDIPSEARQSKARQSKAEAMMLGYFRGMILTCRQNQTRKVILISTTQVDWQVAEVSIRHETKNDRIAINYYGWYLPAEIPD
jgi:hypothetical protein